MSEEMTAESKQELDLEMLNAELTPDERLVAEEDAKAIAENRPSAFSTDESIDGPLFDPSGEPESNGQATPSDVIPDGLRRRAMDFGMNDAAINQMHQAGTLESMLGGMDRMLLDKLSSQPPQEAQLETQPASNGPPAREVETPQEYELEFDSYMDPSIRGNFEKLVKQNQQLRSQHEALVRFHEGQMQESQLNQFDDMISRLGEDFHPMLGTSLDERSQQGSPANKSAGELYATFQKLKEVSPNMSDEDVFGRAVSALYPDHRVRLAESAVKRDVSDRLRDAKTGRFVASARPSKRSDIAQAPGGTDHAAQEFIDGFLADRGIRTPPAQNLDDMLNG